MADDERDMLYVWCLENGYVGGYDDWRLTYLDFKASEDYAKGKPHYIYKPETMDLLVKHGLVTEEGIKEWRAKTATSASSAS